MGIWKGHRTASRPPGKINMWLNTARRLMIRENPYFNVRKLIPCRNMNARRPGAPLAYHFSAVLGHPRKVPITRLSPFPVSHCDLHNPKKKIATAYIPKLLRFLMLMIRPPVGPSVLSAGCQPQTLSNIGCFGE